MNDEGKMMVNMEDVPRVNAVDSLKNAESLFYSSIQNDGTRETAIKIYNAVNSSEESLDDHKGEVLGLVDVVAHPVQLTDEKTGEVINGLRIVLIMDNGKGYSCVSEGVLSSLQKIYSIVGQPTYNPPLKIKAVEQKTRKGYKTLTLALV